MEQQIEAAVVSYRPSFGLVRLVTELVAASVTVHVVDNASPHAGPLLDACRDAGARVTRLDHNTGVAGALQTALTATEADWLLTLDQDSHLPEGAVALLASSGALADPQVAIVGPVVRDEESGQILQGTPDATDWYLTEQVITSGSLCRVSALREAGGYRTDLVIDLVDWELCQRLRRGGWQIAIEPAVLMLHSLGRATTHRVPGFGPVVTTNHSADRQYYKARNFVRLAREGAFESVPQWATRTGLGVALSAPKIVLFESDKGAKLWGLAQGAYHGLRGRGGPRRIDPPAPIDRPAVSVCMATYNGAAYLREQIDSILTQLGPDDELIIHDDCSTDSTAEILATYDDPRMVWQQNRSNLGPIRNFESVLAQAKHSVVFLADQDDVWLPGKVQHMTARFADPRVTAVVTDADIIDANGTPTGESFFEARNSGPGVIHNFIKNSYLGCAMAIRAEVLAIALPVPLEVRTHDGWIGITADMMGTVEFLPQVFVEYRRHGGNVSRMSRFGMLDVIKRRVALALNLLRIAPATLAWRFGQR